MELDELAADAESFVEMEGADDDAGLVCAPKPKSPKIVPRSARMFCRSVLKLEPMVDAAEWSAAVADGVPEPPSPAEVPICGPAAGAELGGAPGGPP